MAGRAPPPPTEIVATVREEGYLGQVDPAVTARMIVWAYPPTQRPIRNARSELARHLTERSDAEVDVAIRTFVEAD